MRIVTSEHFSDTFRSVSREWSFKDQLDAHLVLDTLDEMRAVQRPPPPKRSR